MVKAIFFVGIIKAVAVVNTSSSPVRYYRLREIGVNTMDFYLDGS